ncbi:MAG: aspartate aminotransferase family protein [Pseudomonadota bacterium]
MTTDSLTRQAENPAAASLADRAEGDVNLTSRRERWVRENLSPTTRELLDEDARYFLRQSLSTPCLNGLAAAKGSYLVDLQGRRFLDFHGNNVHQVGYGHPEVTRAVIDQLQSLSFCPRRYANRPAVELAGKLTSLAPDGLDKVLLTPGGTSALGLALKLARLVTGRFKFVSMWDAFHGASLDALSVGGERQFRAGLGPLLPGIEHVPPAEPYRCLWDQAGKCEDCGLKCARYVDYVLEKEGDVAAVVAEPIRCTAVNPPPPGYWKAVRAACDRRGALLILDETALCLGRTGKMFACEHFEVIPDMLILGKGLGGGLFPLAGMLTRAEYDRFAEKSLGHYTHEKSPVGCAAALAAIKVIEREGLVPRAEALGRHALARLRDIMARRPLVGDVRGLGLVLGLELVTDRRAKTPAPAEAEDAMYRSLAKGLSFKVSQGNFLTLAPPLTIAPAELERALDIIDESLGEIDADRFRDNHITDPWVEK